MMKWIDATKRKPEGKVFWALTEGRAEHGGDDWVIRKLQNSENGDYRSLDYAGAYFIDGTLNGQSYCDTITAWLPLDEIPVEDF
jgi:hypothetical protein